MTDKKYIYTSPDGGKTIHRRERDNYDNVELIVSENYWVVSKPENIEIEYNITEKN
jgi:hypothetical protein